MSYQSEPSRESDTLYLGGVAVLGSSKNVSKPNVTELKGLIKRCCRAAPGSPRTGTSGKSKFKRDGQVYWSFLARDRRENDVTLEIGGMAMDTITLRETHVFPPPFQGHQAPIVALIGCDTAGTAAEYGNHVMCLRARGAGIVIGTIATVFGPHAADVAGKLVECMLGKGDARPLRLGEVIRAIRRESLRDGLLMPLCLVAYGDADWILSPKKGA